MINRKTTLAGGIAAAIFAVSGASAANLQNGAVNAAQPILTAPNGTTVLFDQTANPSTNGTPVQNFSSSYDAYDNEAADDFVVPASGWTISTINMATSLTTAFTGAASTAVNFYPDVAGAPGTTAACSSPVSPSVVTAASTVVTLSTPCSLAAGTYWVAVSVDFNFAAQGQIYWSNQVTGTGNPNLWRNPGDGFASGCTDWGTLAACGVGGGVDTGYTFQLLGAVGGGIPPEPVGEVRELPTLSQWSALLAAGGLALLGLFGLRSRARG